MIKLTTDTTKLQLVTSSNATLHGSTSWRDEGAAATGGATDGIISSATTTDVVPVPGVGVTRVVQSIFARNVHATTTQDVTVVKFSGVALELFKCRLFPGDSMQYTTNSGFYVVDSWGRRKTDATQSPVSPAVNTININVLASPVTNNNVSANTIADVTGLSFPVLIGETYKFKFTIPYTAAATTTGSRWSINGPSFASLRFESDYSLTTTSRTMNVGLANYDFPAAANATSASILSNIAIIEGIITPSANGNVVARFASEVPSSAIVALAGATVEWIRVI